MLVVEFTLARQRFMALNGGMRFEYTHAISFHIDRADQAEVDRLWDAKAQRVMTAMLNMVKLDIAGLEAAYAGR